MDEKSTNILWSVLSAVLVAALVFDFAWVIVTALGVH